MENNFGKFLSEEDQEEQREFLLYLTQFMSRVFNCKELRRFLLICGEFFGLAMGL